MAITPPVVADDALKSPMYFFSAAGSTPGHGMLLANLTKIMMSAVKSRRFRSSLTLSVFKNARHMPFTRC
jgi:hypothetical protein